MGKVKGVCRMNSTNFSYLRSVKKFDPSVIKGANRMTDKTAIDALTACAELEKLVIAIEQYEEYTDGQPTLGTCKSLVEIKKASRKAREALAAIEVEKPADTGTARLVAQSIIGMALADYSGLERQLENDTLISIEWIQQHAESYHAEQCKACRKDRQPLPEAPK
jgi:hypothetical protein